MIYELTSVLPFTGSALVKQGSPEAISLIQELEKMGFIANDWNKAINGKSTFRYNCIVWSSVEFKNNGIGPDGPDSTSTLYKSYSWTHRWTVYIGGTGGATDNDLDFHSHFQLKHQYRGHKLKRFGI